MKKSEMVEKLKSKRNVYLIISLNDEIELKEMYNG